MATWYLYNQQIIKSFLKEHWIKFNATLAIIWAITFISSVQISAQTPLAK